jgi:hypothetical protein
MQVNADCFADASIHNGIKFKGKDILLKRILLELHVQNMKKVNRMDIFYSNLKSQILIISQS